MANFREKAIFVWNDNSIGEPARIVAMLQTAKFEAVYLHYQNLLGWRTPSRIALAAALKTAGITVYASVAVYGQDPAGDGRAAAAIVNQYGLAGCVFDVEAGLYETATDAPWRVRTMLQNYKQASLQPAAFCGWPFYHAPGNPARIYHNRDVLIEAMKIADVGMPMAYPEGTNTPAGAISYLEAVFSQWRVYTTKPLVIAGRAFNGGGGTSNPASIGPYTARALALGAVGVSFWDMEHALLISGMWDALTAIPRIATEPQPEPEEPSMSYKGKPIGLLTESAGWTNPAFGFIIGKAGGNDSDPNPALKPIELQAAAEKLPFLALWDFHPQYYIEKQVGPNDANWPPLAEDKPYLKCVEAIRNRDCKALVIRVANNINALDGEEIDKYWMSYSSQVFAGRMADWLAKNKPTCKVIIATSYPFLSAHAPGIANWIDKYPTMVTDNAPVLESQTSYPVATQKPGYLGNNAYTLWQYRANLVLSLLDLPALYTWLGFTPGTVPREPGDDGSGTTPPQTEILKALALLSDKVDRVAAQVETLTAANANTHEAIMGGLADLTADLDRIFR